MKILVTGSRTWADKERIRLALVDATTVIHGAARGADTLANEVALELGIPVVMYPANWEVYGKRAGIIRNTQMLDREKPDKVIAFWDGESRGTKHMIDYAQSKGYMVQVVLAGPIGGGNV